MNYYIRTTEQRKLNSSYNQIPYKLIVDREHKPIDSFINALYQISDEDSVLMEDDIILCNNFEQEITKVIEQYPNRIINFFNILNMGHIEEKYTIVYNQCTFYPKGIAKQIADIMITLPRRDDKKKNMYSLLENVALKQLDQKVVQYIPHLVQHLDNDTLLFESTPHQRRSIYFIDYVKELGIDYNDLTKHNFELRRLMNKHFKELSKGDVM